MIEIFDVEGGDDTGRESNVQANDDTGRGNDVEMDGNTHKESLPLDVVSALMHVPSIFNKDDSGENVLHSLCGRGSSSQCALLEEILRYASGLMGGFGAIFDF
jgi:hypothetical protein